MSHAPEETKGLSSDELFTLVQASEPRAREFVEAVKNEADVMSHLLATVVLYKSAECPLEGLIAHIEAAWKAIAFPEDAEAEAPPHG